MQNEHEAKTLTKHEALWINAEGTRVIVDQRAENIRELLDVSEAKEFTAQLNRDAMSKVKEETKLHFRPDEWQNWRPTARTRGTIRGVVESVTCLGTNGILGAFVFDFGQSHPTLGSAFFGHVAHFEWNEEWKLKVPVKEEDGTERTVTITQHRGAPPTLYSAAKANSQQRGKDGASGQPRRKAPSKKISCLLATLEKMGL